MSQVMFYTHREHAYLASNMKPFKYMSYLRNQHIVKVTHIDVDSIHMSTVGI